MNSPLLISIGYALLVFALAFGPLFINVITLENEYKSCNKDTLRIEKSYLENGTVIYYLRHKTRLFWIGPYIWEYYQDIYDGNFSSHINFSWFRCFGDPFETYEAAKYEYDRLINYGVKIRKTEIID